jgi:hypothetical protein
MKIVPRLVLAMAVSAAPAFVHAADEPPKEPQPNPVTAPDKVPSDKARPGAPHEPTGWSGTQTQPTPKADPPTAHPPLEGTRPLDRRDDNQERKQQ